MWPVSRDEQTQMWNAKKVKANQWISNAAFVLAKRAGVPNNCAASMGWFLAWTKFGSPQIGKAGKLRKHKANAPLVVGGSVDPEI
eukprot:11180702-Lingulodinium_polyedra.AAC.1